MAFIRKRISPTKRQTPSYQVMETYREGGKVKQRVLCNLGRCATIAAAIEDEIWYEKNLWSWPPGALVARYGQHIPAHLMRQAELETQQRIKRHKARVAELRAAAKALE